MDQSMAGAGPWRAFGGVALMAGLLYAAVGASCVQRPRCVPLEQRGCYCEVGLAGYHTCSPDGLSFTPCACPRAAPAAAAPPVAPTPTPAPVLPEAPPPSTPSEPPPPAASAPPVSPRPAPVVVCGRQQCKGVCCPGHGCAPDADACPRATNGEGTVLACDGPDDCAGGELCCYHASDRTQWASCLPTSECQRQFLHPRYEVVIPDRVVCKVDAHCVHGGKCKRYGDEGLKLCQ